MVRNRMTWTLNTLAFGVVALLVVLPDPDELRSAFEYGQEQRQVQIIDTPETAIVQVEAVASFAARQVEVSNDSIEQCIEASDLPAYSAIQRCIPPAINSIRSFDLNAQRRVEAGLEVHPDPRIEQKRAEISKLCRVRWSGQQMSDTTPDMEVCAEIIQPVAY